MSQIDASTAMDVDVSKDKKHKNKLSSRNNKLTEQQQPAATDPLLQQLLNNIHVDQYAEMIMAMADAIQNNVDEVSTDKCAAACGYMLTKAMAKSTGAITAAVCEITLAIYLITYKTFANIHCHNSI